MQDEEQEKRKFYWNMYYVLVGVLAGIVGGLWSYVAGKKLEFDYPKMNWDLAFIYTTIILVVFLGVLFIVVFRGMKLRWRK